MMIQFYETSARRLGLMKGGIRITKVLIVDIQSVRGRNPVASEPAGRSATGPQ